MKVVDLLEGRGGGKQKAALKLKSHFASRKAIDDKFSAHGWPKELHGTPQEIMNVGDDVHLKNGPIGKLKKIDGRKLMIDFDGDVQMHDVAKVFPAFLSHMKESTNVLDLQMMVNMLNKERTIDEADLLKGGIEVQTCKGDLVSFHLNGSRFDAYVQGKKRDIDCGDIGDSVADIMTFLKGIDKAWYREHDTDNDD